MPHVPVISDTTCKVADVVNFGFDFLKEIRSSE